MKKIWRNIRLFLVSLFAGMRAADDELTVGDKIETDGTSITQKKEANNVYASLIKGEVTQEVKELRHEMYYAERRSHDYIYSGGGHAVKKNTLYDYDGHVENSDGHKIQIVQDNKLDMATYEDYGIDINYGASDNVYGTIKSEDISKKEYTIRILRDFTPKFRIEQYATKIVVKLCGEKRIIDIYVSKYPVEFNRLSRMFVNAIEEIYMGNVRSELIDFSELSFITKNAYGVSDLMLFRYNNFEFRDIIDYDGSYVLRFLCDVVEDGTDLINEFFDESADRKSKEHARREGVAINFDTAKEIIERDSYDVDTAKELIKDLTNE